MAPPPGLHKILRAAAPPERARVAGVAVLDAAPDRRDAGVQRVEDRVLQPPPRRPREEPLHGVHHGTHTGRRGRREVKRPVGMVLQPLADLGRAVPLDRPTHDLPRGDVEGRQKACGPVPTVVVRPGLGMVRRHRKRPPRASQSLYLRLLVHREHDGVVWRVDIKAHDIADLELEPRVARDLEASMF